MVRENEGIAFVVREPSGVFVRLSLEGKAYMTSTVWRYQGMSVVLMCDLTGRLKALQGSAPMHPTMRGVERVLSVTLKAGGTYRAEVMGPGRVTEGAFEGQLYDCPNFEAVCRELYDLERPGGGYTWEVGLNFFPGWTQIKFARQEGRLAIRVNRDSGSFLAASVQESDLLLGVAAFEEMVKAQGEALDGVVDLHLARVAKVEVGRLEWGEGMV